jgi:hypothetical protein
MDTGRASIAVKNPSRPLEGKAPASPKVMDFEHTVCPRPIVFDNVPPMLAKGVPSLDSVDDWLRTVGGLVNCEEPVVFVLGAGAARGPAGVGAWGVSEILEHIKRTYAIETRHKVAGAAYQDAMRRLFRDKGPWEAEHVIRAAVLSACNSQEKRVALEARGPEQEIACAALQTQIAEWRLPPAIDALADLIVAIDGRVRSKRNSQWRRPCVVTTNFDGLVEVALQARHIDTATHVVVADSVPTDVGTAIGIWHVHGHWCRDTMHGPAALQAARPNLARHLRRILAGARVHVMGYGGWQDIVASTVTDMIRDGGERPPSICWTFFEDSAEDIHERYPHVFEKLCAASADRFHFFQGVDLHRDLPDAVRRNAPSIRPKRMSSVTTIPPSASGSTGCLRGRLSSMVEALLLSAPAAHCPSLGKMFDADPPPDLCTVVAALIGVLEHIGNGTDRHTFARSGYDLISRLSFELADRVENAGEMKPNVAGGGTLIIVPVRTDLLVAILMARAQDADHLRLVPHKHDARSADAIEIGASDRIDMDGLVEAGPGREAWVLQFEHLLWSWLFPNELTPQLPKRLREHLYGELDALKRRKRAPFAVVDTGEGSKVAEIARAIPRVTFIERGADKAGRLGLDEFELAKLIRDFLKLSTSEGQSA